LAQAPLLSQDACAALVAMERVDTSVTRVFLALDVSFLATSYYGLTKKNGGCVRCDSIVINSAPIDTKWIDGVGESLMRVDPRHPPTHTQRLAHSPSCSSLAP
jgi:hypothetical protein